MKQLFRHTFAALAVVLMAFGCVAVERESYDVMSELTISVSVSNTPGAPVTKAPESKADINASDYIGPAHDGEKIQTLRIVIVRPDGTIEHNRYMDFQGAVKRAYMEVADIAFKVVGPEQKKVYLFVNENSVKEDMTGAETKIVNYNFNTLEVGKKFPADAIADLKISLFDSYDTVPCEENLATASLPMSECHTVQMPAKDHHVDLYVTRAAVKFTYLFDNQTSQSYSLSQLTISKGSRLEYYMPQITYTGDPFTNDFAVENYKVPNNFTNDYYIFGRFAPGDGSLVLPAEKVTPLPSFYLLEGKYEDPKKVVDSNGKQLNYSMSATLDGVIHESYFPDVPWLPRNTHVVTVITISDHDVKWTVDVYPYGEYWLNPGFGLE